MVDVIHHIKDIDTMFQSIKRVLRENGLVIIFSGNHEHIRNRFTTKYFPKTLEGELKRYQFLRRYYLFDIKLIVSKAKFCGNLI